MIAQNISLGAPTDPNARWEANGRQVIARMPAGLISLHYLAPFSFGDRVAIPSMAHLGTGRVLSCRFTSHPVIGSCWMVTLKLAGSGDVLERPASNLVGT